MHRRRFLRSSIAAVGLAEFGSTVSAGQSGGDYRPGGPWAPNERAVNYEAYLDNQQLGERLKQIDRRSDRVELEQIGASAGREDPIWGGHDRRRQREPPPHQPDPRRRALRRRGRREDPQPAGDRRLPAGRDDLGQPHDHDRPAVNPDGANFVGDDGLETDGELRQRRYNTNTWEEGDSRYINRNSYFAGDVPGYDMNRGSVSSPTSSRATGRRLVGCRRGSPAVRIPQYPGRGRPGRCPRPDGRRRRESVRRAVVDGTQSQPGEPGSDGVVPRRRPRLGDHSSPPRRGRGSDSPDRGTDPNSSRS